MGATILVVDDKSSVRQLLREYLVEQGYRILEADNGENALYTARHAKPDLVLLDIMMPKMDGYEFIRQFRKESRTPIIVITARQEETDAVLGLELGADDYVVKPFRMRELLARIRSVCRRAEGEPQSEDSLERGEIWMNLTTHEITVSGEPVALTPIEFDLLAVMLKSPGRVFNRTQLVDHLFESGFSGLERTLNVHIRNLRKKIEPDPSNPRYIESVFGVGYRFCKESD